MSFLVTSPLYLQAFLTLRWVSSGLSWRRKKMSLTFLPSLSSCRCQMPTVSDGCLAWPGRSSNLLAVRPHALRFQRQDSNLG